VTNPHPSGLHSKSNQRATVKNFICSAQCETESQTPVEADEQSTGHPDGQRIDGPPTISIVQREFISAGCNAHKRS